MVRVLALTVGVLLATVASCAATDDPPDDRPACETEASAAALVLVAQCRAQGEQCSNSAHKHHCVATENSCMTADKCTAQLLACISGALQN